MNTVGLKDFVIVKDLPPSGKNKLVRVIDIDTTTATGLLDTVVGDGKTVSFELTDIIANLGKSPSTGKVFGVNVEPLHRTVNHKTLGTTRLFTHFDELDLKQIFSDLKSYYLRASELRHTGFNFDIEIRSPHGKYAGHYKLGQEIDILCVKTDTDRAGLEEIFAHEFGHGLWFRRVSKLMQKEWIDLYHKAVTVQTCTTEQLDSLLDAINTEGSFRQTLKQAGEEDRVLLKECQRIIGKTHSLSVSHLDLILSLNGSIDVYFPDKPFNYSSKELVISDYAKKNVEEFFAEAYAAFFINRHLPKEVRTLLNTTLSRLTR